MARQIRVTEEHSPPLACPWTPAQLETVREWSRFVALAAFAGGKDHRVARELMRLHHGEDAAVVVDLMWDVLYPQLDGLIVAPTPNDGSAEWAAWAAGQARRRLMLEATPPPMPPIL
jgi:hypothetical protein